MMSIFSTYHIYILLIYNHLHNGNMVSTNINTWSTNVRILKYRLLNSKPTKSLEYLNTNLIAWFLYILDDMTLSSNSLQISLCGFQPRNKNFKSTKQQTKVLGVIQLFFHVLQLFLIIFHNNTCIALANLWQKHKQKNGLKCRNLSPRPFT